METYSFEDCTKAAEILREGGLVAFPTETVFGIGCRFDSREAFDRLVSVKRRPATKPFTMMLSDSSLISEYAYVTPRQQKLIDEFMPGEVTFIFKRKKSIPDFVTLGGDTIGIRVPAHRGLLNLLSQVGVPLLVPSANRSGEAPCADSDEVKRIFKDELDGVIEGRAEGSIPSTVVLLTGEEPVVLRQGKVSSESIIEAWNRR